MESDPTQSNGNHPPNQNGFHHLLQAEEEEISEDTVQKLKVEFRRRQDVFQSDQILLNQVIQELKKQKEKVCITIEENQYELADKIMNIDEQMNELNARIILLQEQLDVLKEKSEQVRKKTKFYRVAKKDLLQELRKQQKQTSRIFYVHYDYVKKVEKWQKQNDLYLQQLKKEKKNLEKKISEHYWSYRHDHKFCIRHEEQKQKHPNYLQYSEMIQKLEEEAIDALKTNRQRQGCKIRNKSIEQKQEQKLKRDAELEEELREVQAQNYELKQLVNNQKIELEEMTKEKDEKLFELKKKTALLTLQLQQQKQKQIKQKLEQKLI